MDIGALIDGAAVAITGGTGTLGQALTAEIMGHYKPTKIVIISRSESRQAAMRERFPEMATGPLRYFIADVRDYGRLQEAFEGCSIVIHAAALKRIEVCEREPKEAVLTNVIGTLNAAEAAKVCGVQRFLFVSSDKACEAATLYGGTKYVAERLAIGMNNYRGQRAIRYSAVRYGNVLGSTGSVLHLFRNGSASVTITDPRCTRFWVTVKAAARFVLSSLSLMRGGEVFIPKLASMGICDMATALAPDAAHDIIGLRGDEKIHETLLSAEEARHAVALSDRYVLLPATPFWPTSSWPDAKPMPEGWSYSSDRAEKLTAAELRGMVDAD